MKILFIIDTEKCKVVKVEVDIRLTSHDLTNEFGKGLWFTKEKDAVDELSTLLFNLE